MIPESPFGRPEDKDIQREFMKKIRGDKLQAINAECELEICLAFKYGRKQKVTKSRRGKAKEEEDEGQSMEDRVKMLWFGNNFDINRRENLGLMFKQIKQKWKFEEIVESQPLPDYFFDDGCDLSYIIYELQKTNIPQYQKFSPEDLLFLQLLCLQGRKHLNQNIIKYYEDNMTFMIEAMKNGLTKIEEKLQIYKSKNISKPKQRKVSNEEAQYQNQGDPECKDELKNQTQRSEQEPKQTKTKKIKKDKKDKKKKSKADKSSEQEQEEGENGQQQNNYPSGKQLALKTVNYIAWAYWYIIQKQ